jgi:HAD superfamily hydrolase (TIGR01509 family)
VETTEAVLFDNDGVLVDTEVLFFEATRSAFRQLGLDLTAEVWGASYLAEAKRSRDVALALGADPSAIDGVLEERNLQYWRVLQQPPPLRPQVRETLAKLRGSTRMAIVTGCGRDQLARAHAASSLLGFFDVIITSDDCSNGKPHPEPYLAATRALGVLPERCIAVEDSPRGLASAREAGVPCVVVPTELTRMLPFQGALAVECDLSGVMRHIKRGPPNAFRPGTPPSIRA